MKRRIQQQFDTNLDRVDNLIKIYVAHLQGTGGGRRSHLKTDVLRAAVVFLHATTEDLLRSIEQWKLPNASKAALDDIPLDGLKHANKFYLGELHQFKGKTIDEVIKQSVDNSLKKSTYNNVGEIKQMLDRTASLSCPSHLEKQLVIVDEMMKRRHKIVHRADETEKQGRGHHQVESISPKLVQKWSKAVRTAGQEILSQL
jgi:hypothetical protein